MFNLQNFLDGAKKLPQSTRAAAAYILAVYGRGDLVEALRGITEPTLLVFTMDTATMGDAQAFIAAQHVERPFLTLEEMDPVDQWGVAVFSAIRNHKGKLQRDVAAVFHGLIRSRKHLMTQWALDQVARVYVMSFGGGSPAPTPAHEVRRALDVCAHRAKGGKVPTAAFDSVASTMERMLKVLADAPIEIWRASAADATGSVH